MTSALAFRVAPPVSGRARRLVARNAMVARNIWWVPLSGLFEPVFYLLSIGICIGHLVHGIPGPHGRIYPYAVYVAPALLASSAMNGAIYDSTFNIFFKLKFAKTYDAILSTPVGAGDVALGEIGWALLRGTLYATAFFIVLLLMGLIRSPLGLLVVPAALLIGYAFAGVGMAVTTFMQTWQDFDMVQLVILPLFLFSATFYPLSTYPPALQLAIELTPLYHGVALMRGLTLGAVTPGTLIDVAYLAVMGTIGLAVTSRRLHHLLLK